MTATLVITLVGADRPGLVEKMATAVAAEGGNWEESRMAQLSGQFAGILRVTVSADRADALAERLNGLEGLRVVVCQGERPREQAWTPMQFEVVGNDHPGIVQQLSSALSRLGCNVEFLSSGTESAPMAGGLLFRAKVRIAAPPGVTVTDVKSGLEAVAHEVMVELTVDED